MKIDYKREELTKLLEDYYQRLEGRTVKANIKASKEYVGIYEDLGCVVTITISEELDICGMTKKVEETISKEDMITKLNALFNLYELKLVSLEFDSGLSTSYEGYGMSEREVKTAYFKGATANVEKIRQVNLQKK